MSSIHQVSLYPSPLGENASNGLDPTATQLLQYEIQIPSLTTTSKHSDGPASYVNSN